MYDVRILDITLFDGRILYYRCMCLGLSVESSPVAVACRNVVPVCYLIDVYQKEVSEFFDFFRQTML